VMRGQQIGTIGNCHGLYPPHLHFEFHKNLEIGVVHTLFAGDYSNYYSPTDFVNSHRSLHSTNRVTTVAMNNYVMPTYAGIPAMTPTTPATVANQVMSETKKPRFRVARYEEFKD
jgi:murein DD-endopeptidase MepM/ murein hydrolase activator NlpD